MKTTPILSVLMIVFNESKAQIVESVHSMLEQSFSDFELIIVNDNPRRDDIQDIINQFADDRIRIIKNESNIGLAMSMNVAASQARADIYARMDADDIAEFDRFAIEYEIIRRPDVDVVFSNFVYIDNESKPIEEKYKRNFLEGPVDSRDIALRPSLIHHPTVMMKRNIFEKVGGYRDFPCAQDSDLWMRMQENGALFYRIAKPLMRYRINPKGTTQKKYFKQQLTAHYIFSLSIERMTMGKDSFSKDNYEAYMKRCGIDSIYKERCFHNGIALLRKAKEKIGVIKIWYRIAAFAISPQHRKYYNMVKYKKSLLHENISNHSEF